MKYIATKNTDEHLMSVRQQRNQLLVLTDWVFGPEAGFTEEEKDQVRVYRQALKDCTTSPLGTPVAVPHYDQFDMPYGIKKFIKDFLADA